MQKAEKRRKNGQLNDLFLISDVLEVSGRMIKVRDNDLLIAGIAKGAISRTI